MEERWPWEAEGSLEASDPLAHQRHEEAIKEQLPRVVKLLPVQGTVMGSSSPHQTGDIVCYDILKRAPVYDLTSHFSDIQPHAPARGAHRHISAPTLFCLERPRLGDQRRQDLFVRHLRHAGGSAVHDSSARRR